MRLIDADLLIERFNKALLDLQVNGDDALLNYSGIFKAINAAPTVDAIKVVRCADCLYWQGHKTPSGWCLEHGKLKPAMDFCSKGVSLTDAR